MSEQKQADWRTMEAGRDLDRIVANQLGWRFEANVDGYFKATSPTGITGGYYLLQRNSEHGMPLYSTDLSAAFTLFSTEPGLEWNLFSEDDDWITCELGHWSDDFHDDQLVMASEKTAALAICKAWLLWQERTDHPAPEYPKGTENG